MSNYVKIVDYAAKDSLTSGDTAKRIRGSEIGAEFDSIALHLATKLDTSSFSAASYFNVIDYGATGDGTADDTTFIQNAINDAASNSAVNTYGASSPALGPRVVFFPSGYYKVTSVIEVPGGVALVGEGNGMSYAGSLIVQKTNGTHLFQVVADDNAVSAANWFYGLRLRYDGSTAPAGIALIFMDEAVTLGNSIYIERCWFQTPSKYAINLESGNDHQIVGNTFDVSAQRAILLGTATGLVTDCAITNNTFYDIRGGCVDVVNVKRLLFNANRIFGTSSDQIPYVVQAKLTNPTNAQDLLISNNTCDYANSLLDTNKGECIVNSNIMRHIDNSYAVGIGGGSAVYRIVITNNLFDGESGVTVGMIDATSTPISQAIIANNCLTATASARGFYNDSVFSSNNVLQHNRYSGFTTDETYAGT